jgi:hypothetical protein
MMPILELRGITNRFPGALANDHIDLTLNKGGRKLIKSPPPNTIKRDLSILLGEFSLESGYMTQSVTI